MKYKLLIGILVIMFLLVPSVLGTNWQTVFEDDFDDSTRDSFWTGDTVSPVETGTILKGVTTNNGGYYNASGIAGFGSYINVSVSSRRANTANSPRYVGIQFTNSGSITGGTNRILFWMLSDSNNEIRTTADGTCSMNATDTISETEDTTFTQADLIVNFTSQIVDWYYDGTFRGSYLVTGCNLTTQEFNVWARSGSNEIDWIKIQTPLNQTTTDISFTAKDDFNSSSINNFSINLTWANGTQEIYTTSNGSISLINVSDSNLTANITFFNATNYFNQTLFNQVIVVNQSNNLQASLYQAVVNMQATKKINGSTVTGATFYTGTKSGTAFNITAGNHNITFTHPQYFNKTQEFTITALSNTTKTITNIYSSLVNITVLQTNGSILNNYDINISSLNFTSWIGENSSTTNGSYFFGAINGTYQAIIKSTLGTETLSFVVNEQYENVTYQYFNIDNCSSYTQTMINFTILEEAGETLLNDSLLTIWVNATSDSIVGDKEFNFSFSSGNYYALCVPDSSISSWKINSQTEYSNLPTYVAKNYYFVNYSLNSSPTNVNLYLTNGTTQVTLRLRDYNDDPITNAYIKVLSYNLGTNSYMTTEIVNTDSSGDAYAQMLLNTQFYAFLVEYEGEVILQTLPTKLTSSTLTLRANLDTDYFDSYDVSEGVTTDLTFNNNTATFTYTFSDPTGSIAQGCLKLTRRSINGDTLLNTSCVTSTASTILLTIPEAVGTNTYIANGYITISGDSFQTDTLSHSYNATYRTFGLSGVFFAFLIILTLSLAALWHPVASIVLMILGFIVTNVLGIYYLNWSYLITLVILAGITIYRVGKSD